MSSKNSSLIGRPLTPQGQVDELKRVARQVFITGITISVCVGLTLDIISFLATAPEVVDRFKTVGFVLKTALYLITLLLFTPFFLVIRDESRRIKKRDAALELLDKEGDADQINRIGIKLFLYESIDKGSFWQGWSRFSLEPLAIFLGSFLHLYRSDHSDTELMEKAMPVVIKQMCQVYPDVWSRRLFVALASQRHPDLREILTAELTKQEAVEIQRLTEWLDTRFKAKEVRRLIDEGQRRVQHEERLKKVITQI